MCSEDPPERGGVRPDPVEKKPPVRAFLQPVHEPEERARVQEPGRYCSRWSEGRVVGDVLRGLRLGFGLADRGALEGDAEAPADTTAGAPADTTAGAPADTTADTTAGEEGEERPEGETLSLLTMVNSLSYDFIEADEPGKLGLGDLNTRLTTGLGRDFSVSTSFNHSLVEVDDLGNESLDVFLRSITTDCSIRKGGSISFGREERRVADSKNVLAGRGGRDAEEEAKLALAAEEDRIEGFGPWSLNLTHTWNRNRGGEGNRQSVGIGASLLPSSHWSLNYRTNYDITEGQLQGQTLALIRNLHDWQASLSVNLFPSEPQDRVLIAFSVYLRDVPDLEVPYRVRRE